MSTEPIEEEMNATARRVHFSREDIGGELLPILTSGLYRDTLDSLREYIQNAIDAKATEVRISIDPDVVSVVDNGAGMDSTEARKAIRLGIFRKESPSQHWIPRHRHLQRVQPLRFTGTVH